MIAIDQAITKSSSPINRAYSSPKHTNMINANTGSLSMVVNRLGMKMSSWSPSRDPLLLVKKNQMRAHRSLKVQAEVAMDKSLKRKLLPTFRPRKKYRKDLLKVWVWVKVVLLEGYRRHSRMRLNWQMISRLCSSRARCLVRAFNQKSIWRKWLELTKRSLKSRKNIVLKFLSLSKIPWTNIMLKTNVR